MPYFDFCCGGSNPTRPIYGCNAVTWPLVYDESVSIVQQIAYIMGAVNELKAVNDGYVTDAEFAAWQKKADAEHKTLKQYTDDQIKRLRSQIIEMLQTLDNVMIYNVTRGYNTKSDIAARESFNWLAVRAATVDQITENVETVDALADCGLNCRGLATWSFGLVPGWVEPDGIRYVAPPEPPEGRPLDVATLKSGVVDAKGFFKAFDGNEILDAATLATGVVQDEFMKKED